MRHLESAVFTVADLRKWLDVVSPDVTDDTLVWIEDTRGGPSQPVRSLFVEKEMPINEKCDREKVIVISAEPPHKQV